MILNEWGYGAGPRKPKAEILQNIENGKIYTNYKKDLKINRYIISDHVESLLKNDILEYIGIGFDRRKIQIFTVLFYIGIAPKKFVNSFANYLQTDDFPFETSFSVGDVDEENNLATFTWWASFTPYLVSKFTEFLFNNCIKLTTYIVAYEGKDVDNYPLYHANFIPDTSNGGHWNNSIESCLKDPLKTFFDDDKVVQTLANEFKSKQNSNK